jgi:predicted transcriptional regulator
VTEHVGRRPSGALSGEVLAVLRSAGRALTPWDVHEALAERDHHPLAYTTVVTVLSRLHAQGLVDRFRTGRAYSYLAVTDRSRLAAQRMLRVLDEQRDRDDVLASFVSDLSASDEDVLRRLLGLASDTDGSGRDS